MKNRTKQTQPEPGIKIARNQLNIELKNDDDVRVSMQLGAFASGSGMTKSEFSLMLLRESLPRYQKEMVKKMFGDGARLTITPTKECDYSLSGPLMAYKVLGGNGGNGAGEDVPTAGYTGRQDGGVAVDAGIGEHGRGRHTGSGTEPP